VIRRPRHRDEARELRVGEPLATVDLDRGVDHHLQHYARWMPSGERAEMRRLAALSGEGESVKLSPIP
jgi:hypothetical protein